MSTSCLTCLISTGVGETLGIVGLPSLDERPCGGRAHPLAAEVNDLGDDDGDFETFGFIDAGFRAIGLHLHAHDFYRAFLTSHAGHRVFLTGPEPDWDRLLPHLQTRDAQGVYQDPTKFIKYEAPLAEEGYVLAGLVFECPRCDDTLEGERADWVKPFAPRKLAASEIDVFCTHVAKPSAEHFFYEAQPFDFWYSDVGEWLLGHKNHGVVMSLDENS